MSDMPLVSFVVLAYMQEKYIREAIMSALAQEYSPLEILITDDCSTDETFSIIENVVNNYNGPHKVIINRNERNIGLAESINRAWGFTSGDFVVLQAGDDISLPERTTELVSLWLSRRPRPDLVFSNIVFMDADCNVLSTQTEPCLVPSLDDVTHGKWFIAGGMACAYSREIMDHFGPLNPRVVYEDYVLTFRALVRNGISHSKKPLVRYRVHEKSIMGLQKKAPNDREHAAKWALHLIAETDDRIKTWLLSGKNNILFAWRLKRQLHYAKIELLSSSSSLFVSMCCCLYAFITVRPRMIVGLFIRDVLRR